MGLDPNRHVAVASLGEDARYTLRTPSIRSKTSRAWAEDRFPGPAGIRTATLEQVAAAGTRSARLTCSIPRTTR